jgi:hypothetical protein
MEKLADRTTWKDLSLEEIEKNLAIAEKNRTNLPATIDIEEQTRIEAERAELWLRREIAKKNPVAVEVAPTKEEAAPVTEPAPIEIVSRKPADKTVAVNEIFDIVGGRQEEFLIKDIEKLKEMIEPIDGKQLLRGMTGRWFAKVKVGNTTVPMYVSSSGTSSKTAGEWYPFFGYTGDWVVKGRTKNAVEGFGIKEMKEAREFLNEHLKLPGAFGPDGKVTTTTGKVVADINDYFTFGSYSLGQKWTEVPEELNVKLGFPAEITISPEDLIEIRKQYAKDDPERPRDLFVKAFKIWKEKFDGISEQETKEPTKPSGGEMLSAKEKTDPHAELVAELKQSSELTYAMYQKAYDEAPDDINQIALATMGKRVGDKVAYTYLGKERLGELVQNGSELSIKEELTGALTTLMNVLVTNGSIQLHPKGDGKKWPPDAVFDSPISEAKTTSPETKISQQELQAKLTSILVSTGEIQTYDIQTTPFAADGTSFYNIKFSQKSSNGTIMHFSGVIQTPKSERERFLVSLPPSNIQIETKGKIANLFGKVRDAVTDDKAKLAEAVIQRISRGLNTK